MKILVIRFSSIGDIVLTTPVLRCIKQQVPGCELHFLTKKKFASLTEGNPYIDRHHLIGENDLNEVIRKLKKEKYDYVADLHGSLRSRYVRTRLGRPYGSFPKLNREKFLLTRFHINRLPQTHIVDRYFQAVEKLNVKNDGRGLDYFIPSDTGDAVLKKISLPDLYVAFAIGGTYATKRLPDEKIADICRRISLPVVLLGGREDSSTGEKISILCGKQKVVNGCGSFSIHESAFIINKAHSVISHDTGMMHIAAAFKKKIISIWGNTVPEFGMAPYLPGEGSYISEVKTLPCRPCSKLGYPRCPKKHFYCMELQETDMIASAAE